MGMFVMKMVGGVQLALQVSTRRTATWIPTFVLIHKRRVRKPCMVLGPNPNYVLEVATQVSDRRLPWLRALIIAGLQPPRGATV